MVMSFFLQGQTIEEWQVLVLLVIYILHIVIMKYNHTYEVALKRSVANFLEIRELNNLATEN
jgi:hypothetical protein